MRYTLVVTAVTRDFLLVLSQQRVVNESSTKKYIGGFKCWKSWAQQHKLAVFPVEGAKLALYLQHLGDRLESKAAVEEAVNSLAWVHSLAGFKLALPSNHPLVQVTLDGLKRALVKPVTKKTPVTADILSEIVKQKRDQHYQIFAWQQHFCWLVLVF